MRSVWKDETILSLSLPLSPSLSCYELKISDKSYLTGKKWRTHCFSSSFLNKKGNNKKSLSLPLRFRILDFSSKSFRQAEKGSDTFLFLLIPRKRGHQYITKTTQCFFRNLHIIIQRNEIDRVPTTIIIPAINK